MIDYSEVKEFLQSYAQSYMEPGVGADTELDELVMALHKKIMSGPSNFETYLVENIQKCVEFKIGGFSVFLPPEILRLWDLEEDFKYFEPGIHKLTVMRLSPSSISFEVSTTMYPDTVVAGGDLSLAPIPKQWVSQLFSVIKGNVESFRPPEVPERVIEIPQAFGSKDACRYLKRCIKVMKSGDSSQIDPKVIKLARKLCAVRTDPETEFDLLIHRTIRKLQKKREHTENNLSAALAIPDSVAKLLVPENSCFDTSLVFNYGDDNVLRITLLDSFNKSTQHLAVELDPDEKPNLPAKMIFKQLPPVKPRKSIESSVDMWS